MADDDEDVDAYEEMLDILDDGRLPVIAFVRPGLCAYRTFKIEDWSPVMTGTGQQRQACLVTLINHVHSEGRDADS